MPTQIILESFTSRVLAANPLGDPATRTLPIILPPDYDTSGKRYPVLYGFSQNRPSSWDELPDQYLLLCKPGELCFIVDTHLTTHHDEMSSPDGRELIRGEELDTLKRQLSLPDLVFYNAPSLTGSVLEEGHNPALHQGTLRQFRIKSVLHFIAWKYTSFP